MKRNSHDTMDLEMRDKKFEKTSSSFKNEDIKKSLTDNLPITSSQLNERRKISTIEKEQFDIPLIPNLADFKHGELGQNKKPISNMKNRLGTVVDTQETDFKCANGNIYRYFISAFF